MSSVHWLPLLAIATMVVLVAVVAWNVRADRQRARDGAPMQARFATARAEVRELERRRVAGEISGEDCEIAKDGVAATLLETTALQSPVAAHPSLSYIAGTVAVAALAAGAFQLWSRGASDGPEAPIRAVPASAGPDASPADGGKALRALSDEQLQRMVDEAGARVKATPGDAASWAMLAHSYDMLGKFAESSKAYATLAKLLPDDAQVLADYADALAVANGRTLAGEPSELIKKAMAIDGRNLKALALSGTAAYERADYSQAVGFWERALEASPDPAFRQQIEASIVAARGAMRGEAASGAAVTTATAAVDQVAAADAVVAGRVTLADELVAKAPPDATVYIFARPADGSRMPVALLRKKVRDLPVEFSLDDANAMVPEARLSQVRKVVVGARISQRGDVTPRAGDMQGWSAPVAVGTRGIRLEISEVLK